MFICRLNVLLAVNQEKPKKDNLFADFDPATVKEKTIKKRGRQSGKIEIFLRLVKHRLPADTKRIDVGELLRLREEGKVVFCLFLPGGEAPATMKTWFTETTGLPVDVSYQSVGAIANSLENRLKVEVKVSSVHLLWTEDAPKTWEINGADVFFKAVAVDY